MLPAGNVTVCSLWFPAWTSSVFFRRGGGCRRKGGVPLESKGELVPWLRVKWHNVPFHCRTTKDLLWSPNVRSRSRRSHRIGMLKWKLKQQRLVPSDVISAPDRHLGKRCCSWLRSFHTMFEYNSVIWVMHCHVWDDIMKWRSKGLIFFNLTLCKKKNFFTLYSKTQVTFIWLRITLHQYWCSLVNSNFMS